MIADHAFPIEPWHIRETALNLDRICLVQLKIARDAPRLLGLAI